MLRPLEYSGAIYQAFDFILVLFSFVCVAAVMHVLMGKLRADG